MPNLLDSASNLREALLRREFSARDLLGSTLAAIERLDPVLNAIVQKVAATAFRGASASDARMTRGEARHLDGFPVMIKDCFEVAGMAASAGAPAPLREKVQGRAAQRNGARLSS
ncbi:MAG: amidase family protein [Methylocella sp.]